MQTKLTVVGGKANKQTVSLKLPTMIGRSKDADLTIAHPQISRKHCALIESDGLVVVRDLGSLNGTYVNSQRVKEAPLPPDTKFGIGPLVFMIRYHYEGDLSKMPPTIPAAEPTAAKTIPAAETPKPAVEKPKPATETPKSAVEKPKASVAQQKPLVKNLDPAEKDEDFSLGKKLETRPFKLETPAAKETAKEDDVDFEIDFDEDPDFVLDESIKPIIPAAKNQPAIKPAPAKDAKNNGSAKKDAVKKEAVKNNNADDDLDEADQQALEDFLKGI